MEFNMEPFIGVGAIKFGMAPSAIRALLGVEFRSFRRSPAAKHPSDHFPSVGLFAYFDEHGELEAIELASPARAMFEGVNLVGAPLNKAKALLRSKGAELEEREVGTVSAKSLGIRLWTPLAKSNPKAPCESVLLGSRAY